MSDAAGTDTLSAQGTRLNKRGIESRRRLLATAIDTLAEEGPAGASANLIAKQAGVTWGTIQHQFGDTDGVWAAVFDHMTERLAATDFAPAGDPTSLHERVSVLIRRQWEGYARPAARAVENLRLALPRDQATLDRDFPRTAAAVERMTELWQATWVELFSDLPVSDVTLERLRVLIPATMRGLRLEADMPGHHDPEEGVRGLIDAVTAYLDAGV